MPTKEWTQYTDEGPKLIGFKLSRQPVDPVNVDIKIQGDFSISPGGGKSASMSFTSTTWDTPQGLSVVPDKFPGRANVEACSSSSYFMSKLTCSSPVEIKKSCATAWTLIAKQGPPPSWAILGSIYSLMDEGRSTVVSPGDLQLVFTAPANGTYRLSLYPDRYVANNRVVKDGVVVGTTRVDVNMVVGQSVRIGFACDEVYNDNPGAVLGTFYLIAEVSGPGLGSSFPQLSKLVNVRGAVFLQANTNISVNVSPNQTYPFPYGTSQVNQSTISSFAPHTQYEVTRVEYRWATGTYTRIGIRGMQVTIAGTAPPVYPSRNGIDVTLSKVAGSASGPPSKTLSFSINYNIIQ